MRHVISGVSLAILLGVTAGCEDKPETTTGPTIHCFGATNSTGKIDVNCPTEAP